jgi:nitrate/TMAO reductase-like tetraheme cytochrome c subunit
LNICACGNLDPKFRGYCSECLIKLKDTFDRYLNKFKELSEEYDSYTGLDQTKADEKLRLMKNKIEQYEIKLNDNEMVNIIDKYE